LIQCHLPSTCGDDVTVNASTIAARSLVGIACAKWTMIGSPTPYVAPLSSAVSAFAIRCGDTVLVGFTVVNVDVVCVCPLARFWPLTSTVYFVLNFSAPVEVHVLPSAASVPSIVDDPAVTVTDVTVAPAVAATVTDEFGATSLLFAAGVTVSAPGAVDGSAVTAAPAFVPPLPESRKCAPDDAVQPARNSAPPATRAAAVRRDDGRGRMVI
jgi:hypothetical protein